MSWPRWLDPAPHWLWWIPALGMGVFVALAVVIPTVGYQDVTIDGVSGAERDELRDSVDWVKFRPLWRQTIETSAPESDETRLEGVVVGRTLFGVEVVRLWFEDGVSPSRSETDYRAGIIALATFATGLTLLGSATLLAIWKSE